MTFHIITIFPEIFDAYFNESIIRRAKEKGKIKIKIYDLRGWTTDRHRTVDDKPYGGGAGMVLRPEPIFKAVADIKKKIGKKKKARVVLFSAKGKKYTQTRVKKLAGFQHVIMICGRYEGIDERVAKYLADEEISAGDFVLTGGEIPAMMLVDSVTRLLPGVLGNKESLAFESHTEVGYLEYPHYTRPEILTVKNKKIKVPKVLLSGNHGKIEEWKKKNSRFLINK
ncbi:MAG: tRNA (guanosine(37)-N1)-methyltransferase TrmD [Patescibacteria group bacterium]|jgi:tRNA (guanine37-N1)-methyltransferase